MTKTRIYAIWTTMRQRCENPKAKDYRYYGGRGIFVCPEWQSFERFFADMGEPSEGKTIDRRDNNGNYCKENCKWATWAEQANNRRPSAFAEVNGVKRPIREIEISLGLSQGAIWQRVNKKGWSMERAVTTPHLFSSTKKETK